MAEDKHTIRNSVIATVVGGLILSFILWLIGYLPAVWGWIKKATSWLWGAVTSDMSVPIWLLTFLIVFSIPVLWRISIRTLSMVLPAKSQTYGSIAINETSTKEAKDQYSQNEQLILKALASANGGPLYLEAISRIINQNQLRTEQTLDLLMKKDLVQENLNYIHGASYYLSDRGRDIAIELGYA